MAGLIMMTASALTREFERTQLTIPLSLAIGFLVARWLTQSASHLDTLWKQVGTRRSHWLVPAIIVMILSLLPSLIRGHFPYPGNHDELSYHLAADTYVHGRLSNPTPAGWEHFESFHINVVPGYHSKYQPGMGLALAVGQLLGHTYLGVLIALLTASTVLAWAFQQWLPLRWAWLASILASLMMCSNWSDCYFVGGPLAATGSALLLSTFRQLWHRIAQATDGILLALGLVLLAWSRPFEGAILSVLVGIPTLLLLLNRTNRMTFLTRVVPCSLLVLVPAILFQLQLNEACTGHRQRMPYLEHESQYGRTPLFLVSPPRSDTPIYRHEQIRLFNQQMFEWYQMQRNPSQWWTIARFKFGVAWTCFYGLLWLIPLATLPELLERKDTAFLLLIWVATLSILATVSWFLHHYAAPAFPAWTMVIVFGVRFLCLWKYRSHHLGKLFAIMLLAAYVSQVVLESTMAAVQSGGAWTMHRESIRQQLLNQGDRHLVLITYAPGHNTGQEWVYNSADIQSQPIIWARSMSPEKDAMLMLLYPNRTVWQLYVDSNNQTQPYELKPYQQTHPSQ
jgi:hypothetical protein